MLLSCFADSGVGTLDKVDGMLITGDLCPFAVQYSPTKLKIIFEKFTHTQIYLLWSFTKIFKIKFSFHR